MKMKNDNKGMSLVELMVAVAILSIIMLGIGFILSAMSKNFGQSQREVALQDSMQLTYSIVSDIVKSAQVVPVSETEHNQAIYKNGNNVYILTESFDQAAGLGEAKKVASKEATGHIISYDASKKKLYLYTATYDRTVGDTYNFNATDFEDKISNVNSASDINKPENLLANNVKSFDVVTTHMDDGYVIVNLELEYGGRTASITQNVYLRNSNKAVQWADTITGEVTPSVTAAATPTPTPTPLPGSEASLALKNSSMSSPNKNEIQTHNTVDVNYESTIIPVANSTEGNVEIREAAYKCSCGKILNPAITQNSWDGKYNFTFPPCGSNGCPHQYYTPAIQNSDSDIPTDAQCASIGITRTVTITHAKAGGKLIIKNSSLSEDISNAQVVVYFEDDDAYFRMYDASNAVVLDKTNTTGTAALTYETTSTDINGKYKYLKINIPTLKKAEKVDNVYVYDQYVINYSWNTSSGQAPIVCTYYVTAD